MNGIKYARYIRTKDGIYRHSLIGTNHYKYIGCETSYGEMHGDDWSLILEREIINQADTIEELIDEKVLIEKDGHPTLLETVEFDRNIYLRINEYEFATQLPSSPIICGSIWAYDSNGIPTLKPVAKMKGILSNGEIDWELL